MDNSLKPMPPHTTPDVAPWFDRLDEATVTRMGAELKLRRGDEPGDG